MTEVLPLDDEAGPVVEELFARKGQRDRRGGHRAPARHMPACSCSALPSSCARPAALDPRAPRRLAPVRRGDQRLPRRARRHVATPSGIEPDLVTLGKILGGGMPVGAYLARDPRSCRRLAPLGHRCTKPARSRGIRSPWPPGCPSCGGCATRRSTKTLERRSAAARGRAARAVRPRPARRRDAHAVLLRRSRYATSPTRPAADTGPLRGALPRVARPGRVRGALAVRVHVRLARSRRRRR